MKKTIEEEVGGKFYNKRLQSYILAASYGRLGMDKKAEAVENCGTELEFKSGITDPDHGRLIRANFCKDRLCSMCSWRRSKKIYGQISQIMNTLENNYAFVFLTLTTQNCYASKLQSKLLDMQKGFERLCKTKQWKAAAKGYFKILEITRNREAPACFEYHPHYHIIMAVNPSYFTDRTYISQKSMREIWRDCMRIDYLPVIDMRKIRPNPGGKDSAVISAVKEVSKYTLKSGEILNGSDREIDATVKTLAETMKDRRICAFGGCFKTAAQELNLEDAIDGDLVQTDQEQELRPDLATIITKYKWNAGLVGYELISREEMQHDAERPIFGLPNELYGTETAGEHKKRIRDERHAAYSSALRAIQSARSRRKQT